MLIYVFGIVCADGLLQFELITRDLSRKTLNPTLRKGFKFFCALTVLNEYSVPVWVYVRTIDVNRNHACLNLVRQTRCEYNHGIFKAAVARAVALSVNLT